MIYSTKKFAQLASFYCQENNIKNIIISPGSRNAPLTINFTNNPFFNCYSIVDERSASFFALGIAQQTKVPTVLICTSGSALLNYYPAIAEAYYSDIPLIIISADRPKHLLEIGDGQTIKQNNVFVNHILKSINLNEKKSLIDNSLLVNKTIQISIKQKGPVHINIPFDEPLYETTKNSFEFPSIKSKENQSLLNETPLEVEYLQSFADKWNNSTKKMVLIGAHHPSELLQIQINHLTKDPSVLILTETTSNTYHKKTINGIDKLINSLDEENLKKFQPEILITIGGMIVSKKIKQFLRNYQPKEHWHINPKWKLNTFHCLTEHFKISATLFFSQFFFLTKIKESDYQNHFLKLKKIILKNHNKYIDKAPFSDLKVFATLLNSFPKNKIHLQLANSTTIRYSQLFDLSKNLEVFCNRGTSGIDGSTSTAFGAALFKNEQTIFITGDISFFYDSNALWNKYLNPNIRIILINNSGGGIFRFIEGPKSTNSLDYFETTHNLNAEKLCEMHFIKYEKVSSLEELKDKLNCFFYNSDRPKLLEINTPREINDTILKNYFNFLKKNSYI
jgi:2-succinyl-5-enolpyruvyl-6-hydroxy-3-cyclohexene-1-carboxylate synthase